MDEALGIKLENLIEDIYQLTTTDWTDKELEALDHAAEEVRSVFRVRRLRLKEQAADHLRRLGGPYE